jgi:integrase
MAWEHLDLRHKVRVIPGEHTKNDKPHLVHLSEPVLGLLEAVPRTGELVGGP